MKSFARAAAAAVASLLAASAAQANFLSYSYEVITLANGHALANVYANFSSANDRVQFVYHAHITCNAPFLQSAANPFFRPGNTENKLTSDDTWVTIGTNPNGSGNAGGNFGNVMGDPDFVNFNDENGATDYTSIQSGADYGAGWYNANPTNSFGYAFDAGRVMLAHIAIANPTANTTIHWDCALGVVFEGAQSGQVTYPVGAGLAFDFVVPGPAAAPLLGILGLSSVRSRRR